MKDQALNIYQRINAVQQEGIIYLKKGDAGQGTGVGYDDLISKIAPHLVKHGIIITIDKMGASRSRPTAKGNYIYECDYEVTYINIDDPTDRLVNIVESHAQDNGDKATGKSTTYAAKISMLKVFGIESGDNEESREETADNIFVSPEQAQKLFDILCLPSGHFNEVGAKMAIAFRIGKIESVKASKFDLIMQTAKAAHEKIMQNAQDAHENLPKTPLLDRKIEFIEPED